MLGLTIVGRDASTTVIGGALHLWDNEQKIVGALVLFTAVIAPALQIGLMLAIVLGAMRERAPRWVGALLRYHPTTRIWSIIEVMMVGVLVALVKIADYATVIPGVAPFVLWVLVPVTIPASVDQPEFVVQVAANRVQVDEFNRWVSPLGDAISRTVAGDLVALLGTPDVASGELANFTPDYRVTIDVQRFESVQGQAATLEAVWTVRKTAGGEIRSGRTVAREPVQGPSYDELAAAHSQALAKMSGDIAAAIRAEAEQKS
jgi:uncharacterized lipoprotein YmbA